MINKNEILDVLNFWNYWEKGPENIVSRDKYQKKVDLYKKANEIIVLEGIRRCGKSTLMTLEIRNLINNGIIMCNNII